MSQITTFIVAMLSAAVSALISWAVTRKSSNAQIAKIEAQSISIEIETYRGIINDMKVQIDFWKGQAEEFQKRFKDSMNAIAALESEIRDLKRNLKIANDKILKLEKNA